MRFRRKQIETELNGIREVGDESEPKAESELPEDFLLAKFVLLRWDQLEELAHYLLAQTSISRRKLVIDSAKMKAALTKMGDTRLKKCKTYTDFVQDKGRVARDFGKNMVWLVDGQPPNQPLLQPFLRSANGQHWYFGTKDILSRIPGLRTEFPAPGRIKFHPSK